MSVEASDGPIIAGYRCLRKIGSGGMSDVYLAVDDAGERVAIKCLRKTAHSTACAAERLCRESRLLADLTHPNIVAVREGGELGEVPYLVMEFIDGQTLRSRLDSSRPDLVEARRILRSIAAAIQYLHQQGVIHRDLKPENVLIDQQGGVKVGDFGIAVSLQEIGSLTQTNLVLGTLDYMAPEQRHRLPVDARADQFALAVIVYEMLTGKRPLGSFKPPSQHNPDLNDRVDGIILRALSEDAEDRFESVAEFANCCDAAMAVRPPRRRLATAVILTGITLATAAFLFDRWGAPTRSAAMNQPRLESVSTPQIRAAAETTSKLDTADLGEQRSLRLADAKLQQGNRQAALDLYNSGVERAPGSLALRVARADLAWKMGEHDAALDDLREAVAIDPGGVGYRTQMAMIFVQRNDLDSATEVLEEELRQHPDHARAYAYRGRVAYRQRDYEAASENLDKAIQLDVDCGEAYHFRALCRKRRKQYGQSLSDFRNSLRCTPDNPFAYTFLSLFLSRCPDEELRDPKLALKHATTACELTDWRHSDSLEAVAAAHFALGDKAQAVHWCQQALNSCSPSARPRLTRQMKRYSEDEME